MGKNKLNPDRLLAEERRRHIVSIIDQKGRATVPELVHEFGVSAVTVRADLDTLAELGALVRSHGGAVKREGPEVDYPIAFKKTLHQSDKERIGRAAAQLVLPHQTLILDSGTTTAEVARHLKLSKIRPITVITNGLNVALELSNAPQISVLILGGMLRPASLSLVGPQAQQMLSQLNADQLFMGVDGLDQEIGLSTPDVLEAQLGALMIKVARSVTVVADSSKFGRRSLSVIGNLDSVDRLITDKDANPEMIAAIRSRGVEVLTV